MRRQILLLAIGFVLLLFSFLNPLFSTIYGSISGQVIGEDTGKGVEGVAVLLTISDYTECRAVTDKNGYFEIKNLKPGENHMLYFIPPFPYLPYPYFDEPEGDWIILSPGERRHIKVVLKVGGGVLGYVLRSDRRTAIEGVIVGALRVGRKIGDARESVWEATVVTKSDWEGKYLIKGLKPGYQYEIVGNYEGTGEIRYPPIKIGPFSPEKGKLITQGTNIIIPTEDPTELIVRVKSKETGSYMDFKCYVYKYDELKKSYEEYDYLEVIGRAYEDYFSVNKVYKIRGVSPGKYKISIGDIVKGRWAEFEVVIESGKANEFEFVF